jgi:hypothetical protein
MSWPASRLLAPEMSATWIVPTGDPEHLGKALAGRPR